MDVPGIVESRLDGEEVAASVSLTGEDALYVTPTRTLVYRGEGLLSDESVEEFPHDAERVEVEDGRRKAVVVLDYGLDGERELEVPGEYLDDALHPILAGVFNANGVTEPGETITRSYRFSELTLVVTDARVVKHIGAAVWDEDYEQLPFSEVTGIDVERGNVASQVVLTTGGRTERIKTPNEQARDVRESVEEALFAYHGVESREAFEREMAADEDAATDAPADETGESVSFSDSALDPIESSGGESAASAAAGSVPESDDAGAGPDSVSDPDSATGPDSGAGGVPDTEADVGGFADSAFETATARQRTDGDVEAELEALYEMVERQQDILERQQAAIERLAEAVSRDR